MQCDYPLPGSYQSGAWGRLGLSVNPNVELDTPAGTYSMRLATPIGNTLVLGGAWDVPGVGGGQVETFFDKDGRPFNVNVSVNAGVSIDLGGVTLGSSDITISGNEVTLTLPNGNEVTLPKDTISDDLAARLEDLGVPPAAAEVAGEAAATLVSELDRVSQGAEDYFPKIPSGCDRPDKWVKPELISAIEEPVSSPLVLDLDGDGIELISLEDTQAFFDVDVNGFAETTGWVSPDDGLLALDVDGNGRIDNGAELFGDQTGHDHGFLALAEHDDNGDGVIDSNDAVYADLIVWQDANGDGLNQEGETQSLSDLGIASISVGATATDYQVAGNDVLWESNFTWSDGTSGTIVDAFFATDTLNAIELLPEGFAYHSDAFNLPFLSGAGTLSSTWVALSRDEGLRQHAHDMLHQLSTGNVDAFFQSFKEFLWAWAGSEDENPTSRGNYIDARDLGFLEQFAGTEFVAQNGNPGTRAGGTLANIFDEMLNEFAASFLVQSAASSANFTVSSPDAYDAYVESHPFGAFAGIGSSQNLAENLSDVLIKLQSSIDDGFLQADSAYTALGLFRHNLSNSAAEFNQILTNATVQAGLTAEDELFAVIEAEGNIEIVAGTDASETISVLTASHIDAGAGDDTVNGSNENDYINGGQGNDVLKGGRGTDSYVFKEGEGDDIIDERGTRTENDKLYFAAGITIDDLYSHFTQTGGSGSIYDFTIGLKNGDGTITILDDGSDSIYADYQQIQEFVFSDGTTLTRNEFRLATMGTDGDDYFDGSGEDDDFIFRGGEGNDTIYENGNQDNDRLVFADGITIDDLYSINTNTGGSGSKYDFTIGLKNADGTITILDDANTSIYGDKQQINEFVFSDGTTLTRNEFRLATMGTDGDDHFAGSGVDDDFIFRGGEGNDTIYENGNQDNDRLVFADGITIDDLYSINTNTGGSGSKYDFTIGLKNADGTITILDDANTSIYGDKQQINEFVFSDGTTLTRNEFRVATMGTDGDDHFVGSGESDDYVFRGGEGNDTIRETIAATGQETENDRLVFGEGITVDDLYSINTHTGGDSSDHDFTIGLKNGDGTITILDDGDDSIYGNKHHLTEFVFSDGTTMTRNEFRVATMGTAGDDHFDGSGESDDYVFRGNEGHDTISETVFATGQETENDRLVFGENIDQADVFSFRSDVNGDGVDDLVIGVEGMTGSISILSAYSTGSQPEKYRLDEFVFDDGTTLDYDTFLTSTLDQDQANGFFL